MNDLGISVNQDHLPWIFFDSLLRVQTCLLRHVQPCRTEITFVDLPGVPVVPYKRWSPGPGFAPGVEPSPKWEPPKE